MDYFDEIQQSYVLGFTPYRLHKNTDGTFATPIRVYDGKVYVLDDVATMDVGDRYLTKDIINTKLVYFVKDDGSSDDIVALQGDRGPSEARGLKGDSGNKGPAGSRGPTGGVALKDPNVLLERLVKWDLLEAEVELEHVVKKATGDTLVVLVNKDLYVHKVVLVQEMYKALEVIVDVLVLEVIQVVNELLVIGVLQQ